MELEPKVVLYISTRKKEVDVASYRYYRVAANPGRYANISVFEKLVVSAPGSDRRIIGLVREILNDPNDNTKSVFIELNQEDFKRLDEWLLLDQA